MRSLLPCLAVDQCRPALTSGPAGLHDQPTGGKAPLGLPKRLAPWPPPLSRASRLVGVFRPMVQLAALPMCSAWEHLPRGRAIAPQLIGHDAAWDVLAPLQERANAWRRGLLSASALSQDGQDRPALIDRPPAIVALTRARQQHRIPVPCVTWLRATTPEWRGIVWPQRPAPLRRASSVTMMPRANRHASTSRSLRQQRQYSHPPWLMISAGRRWCVYRVIGGVCRRRVWPTKRALDTPLDQLTKPLAGHHKLTHRSLRVGTQAIITFLAWWSC